MQRSWPTLRYENKKCENNFKVDAHFSLQHHYKEMWSSEIASPFNLQWGLSWCGLSFSFSQISDKNNYSFHSNRQNNISPVLDMVINCQCHTEKMNKKII